MGRICSSMGAYSVFTQGRGNAVTKLLKDAPQKELRSEVGGYCWNKEEALPLTVQPGVQFPGGRINDGLIHSMFDASFPVNRTIWNRRRRGNSSAGSAGAAPCRRTGRRGRCGRAWTRLYCGGAVEKGKHGCAVCGKKRGDIQSFRRQLFHCPHISRRCCQG